MHACDPYPLQLARAVPQLRILIVKTMQMKEEKAGGKVMLIIIQPSITFEFL